MDEAAAAVPLRAASGSDGSMRAVTWQNARVMEHRNVYSSQKTGASAVAAEGTEGNGVGSWVPEAEADPEAEAEAGCRRCGGSAVVP
jgi:hypothetical protein